MKIFEKIRTASGKRQIFIFGIRIFSYKKKKNYASTLFKETSYGNIYFPYYNQVVMPSNKEPDIYDIDGNKLRTFFLRDFHMSADPTQQSKYFVWDKFNIGLDVHFYSHQAMLETMGYPKHKFGFLIETEAIAPKDYKIFEEHPNLAKEFDLIFTNSKQIINTIPNARFAPINCSLYGGSFAPEDIYKRKNKIASILSSDKKMCPLHIFRYNLACQCKKDHLCDTFGTFDGGDKVNIDKTLRDYYFSICVENCQTPYLFTERLICAFANQCIPIYLGATEIDKFFNPDGIIKITTETDIKEVLKLCTPEEYKRRIPAVLDNYERSKQYINPWDYIYEKYVRDIIEARNQNC